MCWIQLLYQLFCLSIAEKLLNVPKFPFHEVSQQTVNYHPLVIFDFGILRTENITNGDMVREINRFYSAAENLSLPWANAFMYSEMKLAGATKAELDAVRLLK